MTRAGLAGAGVLVTRPARQSADLVAAIERAGGRPVPFPVMDIVGREPVDVAREAEALPGADVVIFVSANAVQHGLAAVTPGARVAAIGGATAAALEARGHPPDVRPARGFDSEALLAEPALADVRGLCIRIVRGNGGRALLKETLEARGASVDYVTAYERRRHDASRAEIESVTAALGAGEIGFVVAMSVESFVFFLELLPSAARGGLGRARLVTPGRRVIQTAADAVPGTQAVLAAGPSAAELVAAMLAAAEAARDEDDG